MHALVVEPRKEVIEEIEDRLESIKHDFDVVTSQCEAREQLEQYAELYSYVILSLEIPVRPGRPSKTKFGFNLFKEIRQVFSNRSVPVVATLGRREIHSSVAVRMAYQGAFIATKPFEDDSEFSLEEAIFTALDSEVNPSYQVSADIAETNSKAQGNKKASNEKATQELPKAKSKTGNSRTAKPRMVFFNNRVELCGVAVCGDSSTLTRRLLDLLKERLSTDKYKAYSGYELAVIADCESGQQGVSACISGFRNKVLSALNHRLPSGCEEIIINDRTKGYRLQECIEVVDMLTPETKSKKVVREDISGLPDVQQRILQYLWTNQKGSSPELRRNLKISKSVANRHLQDLRDAGLVRCIGKGKATLWLPID